LTFNILLAPQMHIFHRERKTEALTSVVTVWCQLKKTQIQRLQFQTIYYIFYSQVHTGRQDERQDYTHTQNTINNQQGLTEMKGTKYRGCV